MRIPRLYHEAPIEVGAFVLLTPLQAQHVVQVLRLKVGDLLFLFTPQGGDYLARIEQAAKQVRVCVLEEQPRNIESPLQLHLGQGLVRGEKMDLVIQKAVELGVYRITPLWTQYSNVKLDSVRSEQRLRHWQQIAIHACQQCGRTVLPHIDPPTPLEIWLKQSSGPGLVLDPESKQAMTSISLKSNTLRLVIGPEGGLSEKEVQLAQEQHFLAVHLGPRILRTETAALSSLAILQGLFGDFT